MSASTAVTARDHSASSLYQLQRMFAYLELSGRQSYDALPFCAAFKDESGRPLDINAPSDARSYFVTLIHRLTEQLRGTPRQASLRDTFVCSHAVQLKCPCGGTVEFREDDDFYVDVTVRFLACCIHRTAFLCCLCCMRVVCYRFCR
jgi:hypothetical protein